MGYASRSSYNLDVIEAMRKYGGSFVQSLAECFVRADRQNFYILRNAFPEYWSNYEKKAAEDLLRSGKKKVAPNWMDCNCVCHGFDDSSGEACPHCAPERFPGYTVEPSQKL